MLVTLIKRLTGYSFSVKEAHTLIKESTSVVFLGIPTEEGAPYNAILTFIPGDTYRVQMKTLVTDKEVN